MAKKAAKVSGDLADLLGDGSAVVGTRALKVQLLVSRLLVAARAPEEAIPRVLSEVGTALGWSYAAFWGVDSGGTAIRAVYTWCRPDRDFSGFDRETRAAVFRRGEGIGGLTWEAGRPFWESDMIAHGAYPRSAAAKKVGLHSAFAFPIKTSDAFLGIMEFFAEPVLPADRALLEAAEGVGYQLGEYLERTRIASAQREGDVIRTALVEVALDCIIGSDHRGVITEFNPAAGATFGYRRNDVLGKQMVDLIIPPSYRERHLAGMERYLRTGEANVLGRRI